MVKTVLTHSGFKTALVLIGWLAFTSSFFIDDNFSVIALQTIARVLP